MELNDIRVSSRIFARERWADFEHYDEFSSKCFYSVAMQDALLTKIDDKNLGTFLYERGGYFDSHPEIRAVVYHYDKWFTFKDDSFKNKLDQIAAISNLLPLCFVSPTEKEQKHDIFDEIFGIGNARIPQLVDSNQI